MSEEVYEVSVKTIEHPGIAPTAALAKLMSFTPGRACFVLESLAPETPEGRYSIVGYRVRAGASLPPAANVQSELKDLESGDAQDGFAQAVALASVGYIDDQAMTRAQGVRLHEDTGAGGVFAVRSAVMVYDHHENKVHVAGRVIGKAVERLLWELDNAKHEVHDIEVTAGARPAKINPRLGEKRFKARAGRVQSFVGDEIERAVVREELLSSIGAAQGLDVYRAMVALDRRRDTPHTHGFYIDFGETPFTKHNRIAGLSSSLVYQRRRGEPGRGPAGDERDAWSAFCDAVPSEKFYGAPAVEAARVLREVEDGCRLLWGDVVGYACPGGEASWMLAEKAVYMNADTFVCNVGVEVAEDTDCSTLADVALEEASDQLAALVAAQKHAETYPVTPAEN